MRARTTRLAGIALAAGLGLASLAACGSSDNSSSNSGSTSGAAAGGGKKIALLLPESKTTRYETFDKPYFEEALKAACPDCTLIYSNANQDAAKQQQQAESALTQGANVLVLDPVDGKAAASVVASAKSSNVPVIAYDRFIEGANFYVSFDNAAVGKLQATTLVDVMKKNGKTSGDIVMINGSPTDPNAADFKAGAHSVIDSSGFKVAAEYDTPDWSPDKAQSWMEGQISAVKANLTGVYAANDGTAGGAIAALKGGGVNPLPPVTGQDAELAAIQRILVGDQAMTVYKPIKPEAEAAAKAAVALANGQTPEKTTDFKGVPATILDPIAVVKDNVKDTVVKDGIYQVSEICTGEVAAACTEAGIS
ncbi:substrate-binding domain-containing protein [Humibacillus xanthopallidus]|uniref:D-xylose transport system substrate-binding protein n=1 Tax=Humibacillus xanthopallidus TaxID=412689 RepID=A0A543HG02_9MICO|nr:substrate-binding domain-containing protein [Humibacillus xanthopallidus]TQM57259.1 D-xylose transport system substrate-binding protein [Humibacillus xanthopallidus]